MKLAKSVIQKIGERGSKLARAIRLDLALELNFTELWIDRCIEANKDNGPLTTPKALQVIEKATGLNQSEILEETEVRA